MIRDCAIFLAGIGFYFTLHAFVDWNTRRGETLAAQACVERNAYGKFKESVCAGAKR